MIIYCPRSTNVIYFIKAYAFNILNRNDLIFSFCWYPSKAFSFALYKPTFTSLSFDFLVWAANFPSSLIPQRKKTLLHPTPTTPVAEARWKLQLFNCKSYYTISSFATHTILHQPRGTIPFLYRGTFTITTSTSTTTNLLLHLLALWSSQPLQA